MLGRILLALALFLAPIPAAAQLLLGVGGGGAVSPGDAISLIINNPDWVTSSDLAPASQFVNGFSGALVLNATTPAGAISAYNLGAGASTPNGAGTTAKLTFPDVKPAFDASGNATTITKTFWATDWLRQTYNNGTLPTEAANSGNARVGLTFNDLVFHSDAPGAATTLAGLYTSGAVTSTAKSGIPVTNNSTLAYPPGIGVWVTPPMERVGASQAATFEFFGGQMFAQGGVPFAAVKFIACNDPPTCSRTVTKVVSTPTVSARQAQVACTGTNGSAVLTSCGDTSAFIPGERLTVKGVPGTPKLLSKTASSLTLGTTATCTTTLNSGVVALPAAGVLNGDGLDDGGFNGATITDANFTTPAGVATITAEPATADVTTASLKPSTVNLTTNATGVTAATAAACTINHIYQGSTGPVTAYDGNPAPVYAATFAAADFTGASFTDGLSVVRAIGYPVIGDVPLDTQTGADGTGCDWFYKNLNGGVCTAFGGGNAAAFNPNGTDVSVNLHNLPFYYDTAGAYAPVYVWVKPTGTCVTAACASSSPTDPGGAAGNYAASAFQAQANGKLFNNANRSHNDAANIVICETAGTYSGFGGNLSTLAVTNKPPMILTSALLGGDCPASGAVNSDVANVVLSHNATGVNNNFAPGMRFNNITGSDSSFPFEGVDAALTTSFNTDWIVFQNSVLRSTAAVAILQKAGVVYRYGGIGDGAAGDGNIFKPTSASSGAYVNFFTSDICSTFAATSAASAYNLWNTVGSNAYGCAPSNPAELQTSNMVTQPLSAILAYSRFMGLHAAKAVFLNQSNLLITTSIFEETNTNNVAALQISGDSSFLPITNDWRSYTTVAGARSNEGYLEGVPIVGGAVASGGTFAAGTYYTQVTYALKGNPTVETSTDGINVTAGTFLGTVVVLNGSMNVPLPCDPNYVAYIYVGLVGDITGSGSSASLGHYATVGGVDAKQLAMCQTVVVTAQGSAHSAPSVASTTNHNELKSLFVERFNIDQQYNNKNDYFGGTAGQAGSVSSGGKVGNWSARYRAGWMGNVGVSQTVVGTPPVGNLGGDGELLALNDNYQQVTEATAGVLSFVKYKRDRSFGTTAASTPTTPATNLGWGDYHIDTSVTNPVGVVPTGLAQWPWDIEGTTRKSGATACGGAYEC